MATKLRDDANLKGLTVKAMVKRRELRKTTTTAAQCADDTTLIIPDIKAINLTSTFGRFAGLELNTRQKLSC